MAATGPVRSGLVLALVACTAAAVGCTSVAAPDEAHGASPRAVEVTDASDDVQSARSDGGPVPHGGVDLRGAALRDGGDVLVVEFQLDVPEPAPTGATAPAASPELVYVLRLWGQDPADRFTLHAVAVAKDGTTAAPGDEVHRCGVIHVLHSCAPVETEPVGTVVHASADRFVLEVAWSTLGAARTDGFTWLAGAQAVQVESGRWDAWFDDAPDRPHPIPDLDGRSALEELLRGASIDPPPTAASFPAPVSSDPAAAPPNLDTDTRQGT